jgi:hypothetical protein
MRLRQLCGTSLLEVNVMHTSRSAGQVLATVLLLSCGDGNGFDPTTDTVAGSYDVTTLRETQNGITINYLALGVTLGLELHADGIATGHLFAPTGGLGGSELDTDLSGTWTLNGSTVTLDIPEAAFLGNVTFKAEDDLLRADQTVGGARVEVILTRVE